jgi:hypothetical protein
MYLFLDSGIAAIVPDTLLCIGKPSLGAESSFCCFEGRRGHPCLLHEKLVGWVCLAITVAVQEHAEPQLEFIASEFVQAFAQTERHQLGVDLDFLFRIVTTHRRAFFSSV